jgi:membrane-bound ClpP family serine protease
MRIGLSIFLIAVGAILRFALETSVDGINLAMTGVILMVVGVIGLVISLGLWSSLNPSRRRATTAGTEVVRDVETTTTQESDVV